MKHTFKKLPGILSAFFCAALMMLGSTAMVFAEAEESMGETMKKAGLNTLMGIGIVFCVLVFLSLIISLFKLIPSPKKPEPVRSIPAPAAPAAFEEEAEDETDDLELVAVITAAIAASEGKAPEGYMVRSIRRRYR